MKCYSELELYCFKEVFRNLSDTESDIRYWNEPTLCRFLELPDVLGCGPVVFQLATFLGAFPFTSQAPCILTKEALIKVVTLMTKRYARVLRRGKQDRLRLFFSGMAVYDRGTTSAVAAEEEEETSEHALEQTLKGVAGFTIDQPADDDFPEDDDDFDQLALAALESLDAVEALGLSERPSMRHHLIPSDNLLKLLELLLLIAPLDAQESLSTYAEQLSDERLKSIRKTANNILWAFGVEGRPGISYNTFKTVIPASLPFLFDGLSPLFEHFLFERSLERLSQHKTLQQQSATTKPLLPTTKSPAQPLIPEGGEILSYAILNQLSFFIEPTSLFHRLHRLYSGSEHGFSISSFSTHVFNWHGPTILLISGTLLPATPSNSRERAFADMLPPRRFSPSGRGSHSSASSNPKRVVYGAYITVPWKHTGKECFGDSSTLLFQLEPVHDVFRASTIVKDYVALTTQPAPRAGIHVGSPVQHSSSPTAPLGPVSLFIDDGLEFGVFTHTSGGGGGMHSSAAPWRRGADWQDRFEVESLEVWGCGGKEEAERQMKAQEFEEREAKLRRQINVGGTGDIEADKELLRMAGLIGHGQEGGSMG